MEPITLKKIQKILLVCGILSSVIYILTDIIAALIFYPGYSYTAQQVSELSAIGAPTRLLWIVMSSIWTPLVVAFGIGVWLSAAKKISMRIAGVFLIVFGIIGLIGVFSAPMHPAGSVDLDTDNMHLIFIAVQLLAMVLFISFGSGARGKGFRIYSILTIFAMLGFGGFVATKASAIASGQIIPWLGIVERVSVYTPILWIFVLGIVLLREEKKS